MPRRVAVFIDYQNIYMGARRAFCPGSPNHCDGQVDPLKLGGFLKGLRDPTRDLVSVRVYRGMPSSDKDRKGFGAARRQVAVWDNHQLVTTRTRPLNYRDPSDPKEKGIDVLIAVDFVMMAMRGEFDVGVLCSADTDLTPALEAVVNLKRSDTCVETATWDDHRESLGVKGHVIRKHRMDAAAYRLVADPTDYTVARRRR